VRLSSLQPAWNGEELSGTAVLLHSEQGLGDTLQFARYAPLVAARGGRVILGCQPELKRLLKGVPGVAEVKASGERMYSAEPPLHASLLSLPGVFGTTLQTIPHAAYLKADERLMEQWQGYFSGESRLKVGLAWAGSPTNHRDRHRSLPLAALAPLGSIPGVALYALQKGVAAEALCECPPGPAPQDLAPMLGDFADTAALLTQLDLVITVDTAVAHLAGALGRPVWILLSKAPDWRWLLDRSDSPWYPSARLFRQSRLDQWADVVTSLTDDLATLSGSA
jgi:hypothetical protein